MGQPSDSIPVVLLLANEAIDVETRENIHLKVMLEPLELCSPAVQLGDIHPFCRKYISPVHVEILEIAWHMDVIETSASETPKETQSFGHTAACAKYYWQLIKTGKNTRTNDRWPSAELSELTLRYPSWRRDKILT